MNRTVTAVKTASLYEPVTILRWALVIVMTMLIVPILETPGQRITGAGILLVCSALVILRYGQAVLFSLRIVDPWIWSLFALTTLSISWSPEPLISSRRVLEEGVLLLTCIVIFTRGYTSSWLTTNLRTIATILLLISIVVCVMLPEYGLKQDYDGTFNWIGIMNSKNQLGRLCVLCVTIYLFTVHDKDDSPQLLWRLIIISLSIATLYFSDNATSMAVLALILVFFVFTQTAKWGWSRAWYFSFGGILIAIGYFLSIKFGYPTLDETMELATGIVNRDGITGREDLWAHVWIRIMEHPLVGTGYGASWLGAYEGIITSNAYVSSNSWSATQAHNSYLDILLNTGFLGLALWSIVLIFHVRRLFRLRHVQPDLVNLHFSLLIIVLISSQFSTLFYRGLSGPWNIILWVSIIEICYLTSAYRSQQTKFATDHPTGS